jgi:hypothetical protein
MLSLGTSTKIGLAAAAMALGVTAFTVTPAAASYVSERCDSYGCFHVRCDNDGDNCSRISSYYESEYVVPREYVPDEPYYHSTARYLCSSDGEDCRWTNTYRDDDY